MNPSILSTIPTTSKIHDFFTRHDDKQQNGLITRLDRSPIRQKKWVGISLKNTRP
jgi:hypothetical protein